MSLVWDGAEAGKETDFDAAVTLRRAVGAAFRVRGARVPAHDRARDGKDVAADIAGCGVQDLGLLLCDRVFIFL